MPEAAGPLAGLLAVDFATPRAELAGRMLAELGATVIKVEPPGGAAARFLPPFDEAKPLGPGNLAKKGRAGRRQKVRRARARMLAASACFGNATKRHCPNALVAGCR